MDPYNGNPKDINRTNNNSAFGDIFLMAVIMVFLHSHNATNHGEREITVTVVPAVLMKIVSVFVRSGTNPSLCDMPSVSFVASSQGKLWGQT